MRIREPGRVGQHANGKLRSQRRHIVDSLAVEPAIRPFGKRIRGSKWVALPKSEPIFMLSILISFI